MPLVDIHLIEGVFDKSRSEMISRSRMPGGDRRRSHARITWVVSMVESGQWGVGGQALTTADVKALKASNGHLRREPSGGAGAPPRGWKTINAEAWLFPCCCSILIGARHGR
jgi:4-oxalocrotonate tautomerase